MNLEKRGKYWYIRYGKDLNHRRKSLKTKSKVEAEELYAINRADYLRGLYDLRPSLPKITLFEAVKKYLEVVSLDLKKGTIKRYITSFNQILPILGESIVGKITQANIEQYKTLRRTEATGATVNRDVACLKTFYVWAIKQGYASENPVVGIKFFKEPIKEPNVLTAAGCLKLLDACDEPFIKTFIMIALHTGCRLEEILKLKWEDVHFEDSTFVVLLSKRNRDDVIHMNSELTKYLSAIKREDGYVVSKSDGSRFQNIRKAWERVVKRAGIKRITPHDLRHSWATLLREAGADLRTLQELGRWSDLKLLERYSHVREQQLRDTVEMICPLLQKNGSKMAHSGNKGTQKMQHNSL